MINTFIKLIQDLLSKQPTNIAICSIGIEDPEDNGKLYFYGWDGNSFLGEISS